MSHKKIRKYLFFKIGEILIPPLLFVLCKTLKVIEINKSAVEKLLSENRNIVFGFWHGKMIIPWYILKRYNPSTIVSSSKDGQLLVNVLEKWNYDVRRGSSNKGGKEALDLLIEDAKAGKHIAITPDGPKGPPQKMKAGLTVISKKVGTPVILVGAHYCKSKKLASWDRFEIPYFFSKVILKYSDPIYIDENLTYDETNEKILEMNNLLNKLEIDLESLC